MFISKSRPMPVLKYPIAPITLFLAFGILTGNYFNFPLLYSCIFSAISFSIVLFTHRLSKRSLITTSYFSFTAFAFAFSLGMLTQSLHYAPNNRLHYSHLLQNNSTVIKGVIIERLKPNKYTEKYYFEITSVNQKAAIGKVLLTQAKDSLNNHFQPGTVLFVADTPLVIPKPLNPYQFDYASYMQKQDVFHQLKLKDNYLIAGINHNFSYYIGRLRHKLVSSFAIHHFSPQVQNTLNALLLGQRQDMDTETNNAYKDAGVLHILAISGLHFAVLFYVLTYAMRPLKRLKGKGSLVQLITIISLLWGFALITGLSASVVRSVVMFTFISIGKYLNRNSSIYNSLAVSMLVLLIAEPDFLFDAGFQLSYLAVFAIVWLQPFYTNLKLSKYKGVNYFSDTVLVSLAAQIGVLPLSLYYFNRFPLLFLVANLVVIPLSNIILVMGLLVLLLNFIWADAAVFLGKVLGFLVELMNGFIAYIASFDSLILKDIPFTALLTVTLYIVITIFGLWLYKKSYVRTVGLLIAVLAFQGIYVITAGLAKNQDELVVFNTFKNTMIADKAEGKLTIMSNDSFIRQNTLASSYARANFNPQFSYKHISNVLWYNKQKILIIDKDVVYTSTMTPDVLILTQSVKVNLERLIQQLHPKKIIADGSNYKSRITQWKATCLKQKIPFHATAEKGFCIIE